MLINRTIFSILHTVQTQLVTPEKITHFKPRRRVVPGFPYFAHLT